MPHQIASTSPFRSTRGAVRLAALAVVAVLGAGACDSLASGSTTAGAPQDTGSIDSWPAGHPVGAIPTHTIIGVKPGLSPSDARVAVQVPAGTTAAQMRTVAAQVIHDQLTNGGVEHVQVAFTDRPVLADDAPLGVVNWQYPLGAGGVDDKLVEPDWGKEPSATEEAAYVEQSDLDEQNLEAGLGEQALPAADRALGHEYGWSEGQLQTALAHVASWTAQPPASPHR